MSTSAIERLFIKGVRYSTVIDVGCADGYFYLDQMGFFPGAVPLNIDANRLYEESLKAIKDVVGGDYRISAITDYVGEIEITESVHPYWSSIKPEGDPYWARVNDLITTKVKVPATTLDTLAKELELRPPFLLKLDVQGAEKAVLAGGRAVLENTSVVISEADIDDFQDINKILVEAGFSLYDVTELSRLQDGTLGWFYPVYINKALDSVRPKAFWDFKQNEAVIGAQVERRKMIIKSNAETLDRIRNPQRSTQQSNRFLKKPAAAISRNQPCPCGSGRRYKHCCGANL
jgi:FkbM family methyltransferase